MAGLRGFELEYDGINLSSQGAREIAFAVLPALSNGTEDICASRHRSSARKGELDWTSCRNGAFLCVSRARLRRPAPKTPLAIRPSRVRGGGSRCCRKHKERNMAKLTDTQLIVLSKAAARDDGLAIVPEELNKAAAAKVAAGLVSRKLMREMRSKPNMPVWREDEEGRGISLAITREGREAIGTEDSENDNSKDAMTAKEKRRGVGQQRPPSDRSSNVDEPRSGSKQAFVIKMLSRKSGATLNAMVEATGWLPHTTRAALTCLRKRGYSVLLERQDGKPSVYRVAAGHDRAAA